MTATEVPGVAAVLERSRRLTWVTWRKHRTSLLVMAGLFGLAAVFMAVDGLVTRQRRRRYRPLCAELLSRLARWPPDRLLRSGQAGFVVPRAPHQAVDQLPAGLPVRPVPVHRDQLAGRAVRLAGGGRRHADPPQIGVMRYAGDADPAPPTGLTER